jgi:hypothetical protein
MPVILVSAGVLDTTSKGYVRYLAALRQEIDIVETSVDERGAAFRFIKGATIHCWMESLTWSPAVNTLGRWTMISLHATAESIHMATLCR